MLLSVLLARQRRAVSIAALAVVALATTVAPALGFGDPTVVGQWDAARKWPGVAVHLVMLHTGQVLFWRGDETIPKAYLWDPVTELIDTRFPGSDIFCAGHSFLSDGRVLVTGGAQPGSLAGNDHTLVFDPVTTQWRKGPNMRTGRFYPTHVSLGDGRVLIFSGKDATRALVPEVEAYVVGAGPGASDRIDLLAGARKTMNFYPRMHLLPSGEILHVGEEAATAALDPVAESWHAVATSHFGTRFEGTAVMLPPGHERFMIMGGGPKSGTPTATAEILDLSQPVPAWRYTNPMHFARIHLQNVILPDGKVMVIGGTNPAGAVKPAEIFDPATETWTEVAALATNRGYHSTAVLLPDARVLEAGANGNPTREIYSPPYLFRGPRPVLAAAPQGVDYGQPFTVQTPDAASITSVVFIRPGASTHAANMEQRYVPLAFVPSATPDTLDVLAPADPNVAPPGYYMLFLVNGDGVPSTAPFVLLGSTTPPATTATSSTTTTTTTRTTTSTSSTTTTIALPPGAGSVEVRVAAGADDAEEHATRAVALTSGDLELIHDLDNQMLGLRFTHVDIPAGATIVNAWVQFTADELQAEATSLVIRGQAVNSAPAFAAVTGNVSGRVRTTAAVPWASIPPWQTVGQAGPDQRTPDLGAVVQEIVGRPGWARGNALAMIITGTGHRTAVAFDKDQARAPLLHVDYLTGGATTTSPTTTIPTTTTTLPPGGGANVELRVAASGDDAEERATRAVKLTSPDLELIHDADNQTVGLRFTRVSIPKGATVVHAWVQFTVDEVQTGPTSLVIRGQAADNAAPFTTATGNVSSRKRTTATVSWASIPAWQTLDEVGPRERTPDLAAVVQEIVRRPGWASGNALALVITGTGHRTAKAFDVDPARAPLLHVDYRR